MKPNENHNQNYIFIGMPAAGKSTVGVVFAKKLGLNFIDSDILIQEKTGKKLHEIISESGREAFSEIEDNVNAGICGDHMVIATGGSVVFHENAMNHLREIGTVIYLETTPEDLALRIGDLDERGVVHKPGETIADIYEERRPYYEKYADITVREPSGAFDISKILDAVLETLKEENSLDA